MKMVFSCIAFLSLVTLNVSPEAEPPVTPDPLPVSRNLFIITIDGFRWQELFEGADENIISNEKYTSDSATMQLMFGGETPIERRKKLLPFFWNVIANRGQLYGNRRYNSKMNVANLYALSYPGYNEIFTGNTDIEITGNQKKLNANQNVLAYLEQHEAFKGKVAAFTSWDVFPFILNRNKNTMKMNCGYNDKPTATLNENESLIQKVEQDAIAEPGATRHDQLTYLTALEYLKKEQPRILYLGLGETDEAAHKGNYDLYLQKAMEADAIIAALWNWVQSNPGYRNNTSFIITTDHGRGQSSSKWTDHGMFVKGSSQTWMALIGPGIEAKGEIKTDQQLYQKQLAQTIAALVGENFESDRPIARSIAIK